MSELEKMEKAQHESQIIGTFLDWLINESGFFIAERCRDEDSLVPIYLSIEQLLAKYFEIDLQKADEEKREILRQLRESQ